MIVVLATTEEGLSACRARLGQLGVTASEVVAPGDARRLLLAPVAGPSEGARLVASLRATPRRWTLLAALSCRRCLPYSTYLLPGS